MSGEPPPQVVATAGHVDHGKSSLVLRLTGMDPDRFEEEKRRGLTIDLGFAWCALPSGREIGFVDVPGHERFIRNMLAGVGPVRLILFVVAADEGWKPQSEEHLQIVDTLGADGAVVALTKSDLVEATALASAAEDVRMRLAGTALAGAAVVPVSSATGAGLDDLRRELDSMVALAPELDAAGRPRLFVDRVFSIRGAGTVVTGTLAGGILRVGEEVEIYPGGSRARIRGLQTHKRPIPEAAPVSRVAVNIIGAEREDIGRGDALGRPSEWMPTATIEARIRPVRGIDHPLAARGAYKLYTGSAERAARLRLYGGEPARGAPSFARIRLSAPVALDVFDRFVLREMGRRETVAGGVVLDIAPPARPGPSPERRLAARETSAREDLPGLLVEERGAVSTSHVPALTGLAPDGISGATRIDEWWVSQGVENAVRSTVEAALLTFHSENPLKPGAEVAFARTVVADALTSAGAPADPALVHGLLDLMASAGSIARQGATIRLAGHSVEMDDAELRPLVDAVAAAEASPPSVKDLVAAGFPRSLIDAAVGAGALVRLSPEIVMTAAFVERAERILRTEAAQGITVSVFRERLGTSRKYALPLLDHFDRRGITRRDGDVRRLRG